MGCASSRDHCIGPPHPALPSSPSQLPPPPDRLPIGRSLTLPSPIVVHHPPLHQGDSHHLVSLTSTTYGSLLLLDPPADTLEQDPLETPTTVINAWELMDGLDDGPFPSAAAVAKKPHLLPRSLTYHHHHQFRSAIKPLWRHLADDDPKRPAAPSVILYTTSLRGIRRTHEDCCAVRAILRGLRVAVDERDLSMDAAYRRELQALLKGRPLSLPHLFVGGKPVGGAEEVRQLHEAGELGKVLEGVTVQDPGFVCAGCGGVRFVPCANCSGSRKVFVEEEGRMRRCEDCNENGLVRCPNCCSY